MNCDPTRRDIVGAIWGLLAASLGRGAGDSIGLERVCAHVYRPAVYLPPPLLSYDRPVASTRSSFQIGIPEIVLCRARRGFTELFPYFWPLERAEFETLKRSISVEWSSPQLSDQSVVSSFRERLEAIARTPSSRSPTLQASVVLTYTQSTLPWAFRVAEACRSLKASELVVFKDPTVAPYLCELPRLQKGFRREPD